MTSNGGRARRDQEWMRLALAEARRGLGRTSPNPMVGAIVVRDDRVIATGYHAHAGAPHAEQLAIERAGAEARGAKVFVNLEPCCHQGRTPACSSVLIEAGVRRVVAGVVDPNPLVSGKGFAQLESAGVEVSWGVLDPECRRLNAPFFKYITRGLPWVTAKYAMTLDGKIAAHTGNARWISNPQSRARGHRLRDEHDAILVGTTTLQHDDPSLTTRDVPGGRDPIRVVLDPRGEISDAAKVLTQPSEAPTWVVCGEDVAAALQARLKDRAAGNGQRAPGVQVIALPLGPDGRLPVRPLLVALAERDVMTMLIEGGGETIASLGAAGLIDRVCAFVAPKIVGGREAPTPFGGEGFPTIGAGLSLEHVTCERLGDDFVIDGTVVKRAEGEEVN